MAEGKPYDANDAVHVVHMNVRLAEGGAAKIALELHNHRLGRGQVSHFVYGYGERGASSPAEAGERGVVRVTPRPAAIANYASHRLWGSELVTPIGRTGRRLTSLLAVADVVHLHVVHSYWMPLRWLFTTLGRLGTPIVWTAHDYWMITGRCASLDGCTGWMSGCGSCPTTATYPPSILDRSRTVHRNRRELIGRISGQLRVVAPATHVVSTIREALPGVPIDVVHNGLDDAFEHPEISCVVHAKSDRVRVLVVASDLSDASKANPGLLRALSASERFELHTVGSRSPVSGRSVINHGRIEDRAHLAKLYSGVDVLAFTSRKETFGLVVCESLAVGTPVIALDSPATEEVLGMVGGTAVPDVATMLSILHERREWTRFAGHDRSSLARAAQRAFGGGVMAQAYDNIYAEHRLTARSTHGIPVRR